MRPLESTPTGRPAHDRTSNIVSAPAAAPLKRLLPALGLGLSLLLLAAPAARALGPEPGDPAPELRVKEWVGGDPVDPTNARGSVVVILFLQTTAPDMLKYTKPYIDAAARLKEKGLKVCGISRENREILLNWHDENAIGFPLGVDGGSWKGNWGIEGYPFVYVVDIYGEVAYKGQGTEFTKAMPSIDKALREIKRIEVKRADTSKSFEKVWRAIDKNDFTAALKFLDGIDKGSDEKDKATSATMRKQIEVIAQSDFDRTKELEKRQDYLDAEQILKMLEKNFGGTPAAKLAKERLVAYGKDEAIKDEIFAQRAFEQGRRFEDGKKYKEAGECYRAAMTKGSTRSAKLALGRFQDLVKRGLVKQ